MADISPELKTQGSRAFWVIVVVLLGVWFYNEAMTTKRTLREESSLLFSNLVSQYKNIYSTNVGKKEEVDKDFLENEKRFETELTRLVKDFEESPYSSLGTLVAKAKGLSKNVAASINEESMNKDSLNEALYTVEKDLDDLLTARGLLSTSENNKVIEGKKILLDMIKNSKLVPVEAAVSYFMSIKNDPAEKLTGISAIQELVRNHPEFKEEVEQELSRFGIYVPIS